ncbi:DUF4880 domain-containing protein [Halopseudomonas sp.]|uniref:DUF4880 domain-containing protein n=1 Tax=Halopseudomonas sp. TaxID=2901191 RepID=UPI003FA56559
MHHADSLNSLDNQHKLDRAAVREAAVWLVRLHEDRQNQQILDAISSWCASDPARQLAGSARSRLTTSSG